MKIEELIKELSEKAFDSSITTHTTRFPELREQLKKVYCIEQVEVYQMLQEGKERNDFIKYLWRNGK